MINYGDWKQTSKLTGENSWTDPHKNAFGGMLRALDPMTYAPGPIGASSNAIHDAGDSAVTGVNTLLSPVVKGTNKFLKMTSPGVQYAEDRIPMMGGINRFVEDKPFDAAALAAATYFTGGAAAKGLGAVSAPAASGGAGATGGATAITGATGANVISPTLTYAGGTTAATGTGAVGGGGLLTVAGPGTLGAAGTAAGTSMLTPALHGLGTAAAGGFMNSAINAAKPYINAAKTANRYRSNFSNFSSPDTARQSAIDKANRLSQEILNSNPATDDKTKRIAQRVYMNKWGVK